MDQPRVLFKDKTWAELAAVESHETVTATPEDGMIVVKGQRIGEAAATELARYPETEVAAVAVAMVWPPESESR